jgi:hypothetical protein
MSIVLLTAVGATVWAQEASIAGDWVMTAIGAGNESYSGDALEEIGRAGETMELTEDGEVTWTTNDSRESGTYTYDPESGSLRFDVVNQDDQPAEYQLVVDELTEERLVMSIPDVLTYTFERR